MDSDLMYGLMFTIFGAIGLFVITPVFWAWWFDVARVRALLESIEQTLKHAPWEQQFELRKASQKWTAKHGNQAASNFS